MFHEENYDVHLSKDVSYNMKRAGKTSVVLGCLFIHYLSKELCHWEKTHARVVTFIDGKHSIRNFDPQICINFQDWENRYMDKKSTVKSLSDK